MYTVTWQVLSSWCFEFEIRQENILGVGGAPRATLLSVPVVCGVRLSVQVRTQLGNVFTPWTKNVLTTSLYCLRCLPWTMCECQPLFTDIWFRFGHLCGVTNSFWLASSFTTFVLFMCEAGLCRMAPNTMFFFFVSPDTPQPSPLQQHQKSSLTASSVRRSSNYLLRMSAAKSVMQTAKRDNLTTTEKRTIHAELNCWVAATEWFCVMWPQESCSAVQPTTEASLRCILFRSPLPQSDVEFCLCFVLLAVW